ncbi:MAG: hypothetical protein AVDCRST_MAG79-1652, partial [uncultured Thermoleophilia bacterium]
GTRALHRRVRDARGSDPTGRHREQSGERHEPRLQGRRRGDPRLRRHAPRPGPDREADRALVHRYTRDRDRHGREPGLVARDAQPARRGRGRTRLAQRGDARGRRLHPQRCADGRRPGPHGDRAGRSGARHRRAAARRRGRRGRDRPPGPRLGGGSRRRAAGAHRPRTGLAAQAGCQLRPGHHRPGRR